MAKIINGMEKKYILQYACSMVILVVLLHALPGRLIIVVVGTSAL